MKNAWIMCCCFAAAVPFLSGLSLAQERDIEEMLFEIGKMGVEVSEEAPSVKTAKIILDKEVKYVAGEDKQWFTDDDAVYEHYQIERDAVTGNPLKSMRYLPGKDKLPFTYDDVLKEFQVFEYGFDGRLIREYLYDGQSPRKYKRLSSTVYEYDQKGRKTRRVCSYPGKKEPRTVVYSYDEAGNQVKAVDSLGKNIEKYHIFEYDSLGKLERVVEYHVDHNGKGADGVWFTADDVVSSAKESFYNPDGTRNEDNKYIGAGPDGEWFTGDDLMQYYVLFGAQDSADL